MEQCLRNFDGKYVQPRVVILRQSITQRAGRINFVRGAKTPEKWGSKRRKEKDMWSRKQGIQIGEQKGISTDGEKKS